MFVPTFAEVLTIWIIFQDPCFAKTCMPDVLSLRLWKTETKSEALKLPQNPTLILKSYNSKNISRLRFGSRTVEQKRNATSRRKHFVKSSKCKPLQPPSFLWTTILRASTSKKTLSTIVSNRCFQEANKPASSKASKPTRCSSQIQWSDSSSLRGVSQLFLLHDFCTFVSYQ